MQTLHWDTALPLSFVYGGKPSAELLSGWTRSESSEPAEGGSLRHVTYSDPATGLRIVAHVRTFDAFPSATDWVLEFENTGSADTPILEDILPLDLTLPLDKEDRVTLHHAKGSLCDMDDFVPRTQMIRPSAPKRPRRTFTLAPIGGRSSNGVLPFMNLQTPEGGMVLAIGWTGQWAASFSRDAEGALQVTAGMEKTHLLLHPGEKMRTPRILVIGYQGEDPFAGNNLLRRIILAHYTPRDAQGENITTPIAHNTMSNYYVTHKVGEASELEYMQVAADVGAEGYWLDACWYGAGGEWWEKVGDWRINRRDFPNGLKVLGDRAHELGLDFILWFEPERVRNDTPIANEHPEFLLHSDTNPDNHLLNLGDPKARAYITDAVAAVIAESGVDVYRQDFNFEPLPYWQANDAPDRQGMTEIRHIEGMYAFWDELRTRFPGMPIDNCASGGRRIDLETTVRSYPLWRSDFSDFGGPTHGRWLQVADQIQTSGLSRWIPFHAAAVWTYTPYDTRSAMSYGVIPYTIIVRDGIDKEAARAAFDEIRSLRPYFLGDFYPLLPLVLASHDWTAYQFDRPDLGEGFAVFFRRHESPFAAMRAALMGIDEGADYEVSLSEGYAEGPRVRMAGSDLAHLHVTIEEQPGSLLVRYKRV
ncbi:MAG: glycoside hydrolase family 36 protein [Anaerolineae bacterium]